MKNNRIYNQSRRLPSCTGGRASSCTGVRWLASQILADTHACNLSSWSAKVASNDGASAAVWRNLARACPRPPRAAMGCLHRPLVSAPPDHARSRFSSPAQRRLSIVRDHIHGENKHGRSARMTLAREVAHRAGRSHSRIRLMAAAQVAIHCLHHWQLLLEWSFLKLDLMAERPPRGDLRASSGPALASPPRPPHPPPPQCASSRRPPRDDTPQTKKCKP